MSEVRTPAVFLMLEKSMEKSFMSEVRTFLILEQKISQKLELLLYFSILEKSMEKILLMSEVTSRDLAVFLILEKSMENPFIFNHVRSYELLISEFLILEKSMENPS